MAIKNNVEAIQKMTRKAGVSSYKTDIVEACEQLSYNLNLSLSTSERQGVADYLIKQVSSKMTVSSPQSIGNVTLQDKPSDVGTVNESAITPAVQQALDKVKAERPEMMVQAQEIADNYQARGFSVEETVKEIVLLTMYERLKGAEEFGYLVTAIDDAITTKYNQVFDKVRQITERTRHETDGLETVLTDVKDRIAVNRERRQKENDKYRKMFGI
jgi:Rod binding domain-containing protein